MNVLVQKFLRRTIWFCLYVFFTLGCFTSASELFISAPKKIAGAPQLDFILNEDYLAFQIVARGPIEEGHDSSVIQKLRKQAKKINSHLFQELQNEKNLSPEVVKTASFQKKYGSYLKKLKRYGRYKVLKQQTADYLFASLVEWNEHIEQSTIFIKKYSGFTIADKIQIYFTHPTIGSDGEIQNNILSLGVRPQFDHNFTVKIWSKLIRQRMTKDPASLVANQLLTENDLRFQLNQDSYLPLRGDASLLPLMNRSLMAWDEYKKAPTDLNNFAKKIR